MRVTGFCVVVFCMVATICALGQSWAEGIFPIGLIDVRINDVGRLLQRRRLWIGATLCGAIYTPSDLIAASPQFCSVWILVSVA